MPLPSVPPSDAVELAAFLATLGVARDARILDVPCGIGRRARSLAEHGFRVTAVDSNDVAIEGLRRRVPGKLAGRMECRTVPERDLPGLDASETFDVVLCLDHALGRGRPEDDLAFLERLRAHASATGFLLVDFLHRDFFAARPRPFAYHGVGAVEQHEFRTFDAISGILDLTWKFYQQEGNDLRFRGSSCARMRLLAPHEAELLVRGAGWAPEAWYGGWDREPVSPDRRKLILVARPAARS